MARIIRGPEKEMIDLDAPPPSIDELCEMALRSTSEETGLSVDFLKTGERSKVEESLNWGNEPLIRNYRSTGYPIGNAYISESYLKKLEEKVKKYLDSIE